MDLIKFELIKNCVKQVAASWALDLDQYNEWMNEEDYEVDEAGRKKIHRVSTVILDDKVI